MDISINVLSNSSRSNESPLIAFNASDIYNTNIRILFSGYSQFSILFFPQTWKPKWRYKTRLHMLRSKVSNVAIGNLTDVTSLN